MKYPQEQFSKLVSFVNTCKQHGIDLNSMHPSNVHYLAYQCFGSGQTHNALIVTEAGQISRAKKMIGEQVVQIEGKRLFFLYFFFALYPIVCNDNHIETAVKTALKQ